VERARVGQEEVHAVQLRGLDLHVAHDLVVDVTARREIVAQQVKVRSAGDIWRILPAERILTC